MIARFTSQILEWRFSKFDEHFGSGNREAFSGANQKWHTRPPPRLNLQTHSSECLHLGIRCDSLFGFVALELPSNQMLWVKRGNRPEYLNLLIADSVAIHARRGLHG